jgi:hypothetical protein
MENILSGYLKLIAALQLSLSLAMKTIPPPPYFFYEDLKKIIPKKLKSYQTSPYF